MEIGITKKQVSSLLKFKRAESGLKGSEVIEKLKMYNIDISDRTLYGYENGVSSPNIPIFLALCKIYEIEDVLGAVNMSKSRRRTLSITEERLVEYFRKASPELQDAALRMLKPEEKEGTVSMVG